MMLRFERLIQVIKYNVPAPMMIRSSRSMTSSSDIKRQTEVPKSGSISATYNKIEELGCLLVVLQGGFNIVGLQP
jgi:hypothetical protein